MKKVAILVEEKDGKLKRSSEELFFLPGLDQTEVTALLPGGNGDAVQADLAKLGADHVIYFEATELKEYVAETYLKALVPYLKENPVDLLLLSHTSLGKDLAPHLSARLEWGLATDCTSAKIENGNLIARRPVYAGKATAEVEFLSPSNMITIRPNSLAAQSVNGKSGAVKKLAVNLSHVKTRFIEKVKGSSARPDVTEAPVVVSGGRSLKNAENFSILEELADQMGAAVGASRAAVDAGFRPHRDQVGQTGKVVSPSLYIACGISGAIQHLAGMRTSKVIVAINTDPEAPIFQVADYGLVADLFEAVPLLTKEIRKLKES